MFNLMTSENYIASNSVAPHANYGSMDAYLKSIGVGGAGKLSKPSVPVESPTQKSGDFVEFSDEVKERFRMLKNGEMPLSLFGNGNYIDATIQYTPHGICERVPEAFTHENSIKMREACEQGIDPLSLSYEELGFNSQERLDYYNYLWSEYKESVRDCGMDPDNHDSLKPLYFQNVKDEVNERFSERLQENPFK